MLNFSTNAHGASFIVTISKKLTHIGDGPAKSIFIRRKIESIQVVNRYVRGNQALDQLDSGIDRAPDTMKRGSS